MKLFTIRSASLQLALAIIFLTCPGLSVCDQHCGKVIIMPSISWNTQCSVYPCLTLEEFANNASQYLNLPNNTCLKVVFLQGNYTISSELILKDIEMLSVVSNNSQTIIKCENGAVVLDFENISNVEIENLKFVGCTENQFRSVRTFSIQKCAFISLVKCDSVLITFNHSSGNITESLFTACMQQTGNCSRNKTYSPAAMLVSIASSISLYRATITGHESGGPGALFASSKSKINITDSMFCNGTGRAHSKGGHTLALIKIRHTKLVIINTTITKIKRPVIMSARYGDIIINESRFINNSGVFYFGKSHVLIGHTNVTNNYGRFSVFFIFNSFCTVSSANISNNSGSFTIRHSNVKFNETNLISKNIPNYNELRANYPQAVSAITSIHSTVQVYGTTLLVENHSKKSGGAIHDSGSLITVHGNLTITNNIADEEGGGAYLYLTDLVCYGNCTIIGNKATKTGGGLHAVSTVISMRNGRRSLGRHTRLTIANNEATCGGGLYFEVNSRINGLDGGDSIYYYIISFVSNTATDKGGAIFINDITYSGTCESTSYTNYQTKTECFLQTYENDHDDSHTHSQQRHIEFMNNTAEKGSILYGGLLDRCTLNLVVDMYSHFGHRNPINGLSYFMNESELRNDQGIASDAVRICFCQRNDSVPDCTYQPTPINVTKGEEFILTLAAVDQVNHPIAATIAALLSSENILAEGHQLQNSSFNCTNLTYAIFSPNDQATLGLYADKGPCISKGLSMSTVEIHFGECTCPPGFQLHEHPEKCECVCHKQLQKYMSECKDGLLKRKSNCWINYDNEKGYIVYPNCPYDYCKSPSDSNSSIDLRDPHGADAQCAHGRSGFLCGACKPGFSLSMGTTHCIKCPSYWRGILFTNILAGAFSGILIVIIIFGFNMTVASGTINGLIFYSNIVLALGKTFLPFEQPNFFTVFIAMLNSEFRLERCLYAGVDAYAKAWLGLLPPLYLITLVLMITIAGKYSSKCAYLMGKRNPVAILATLILLSYTSMIRNIIDIFSSVTITYSDGTREKFWRVDARIKYFQGKHIPLFLITLLFTIVGLAYTFLLFSWQWLLRAPHTKMFQWIRNTKLNSFMDAYLAPYKQKYRFWTGYLLFSRIVVHFMLAVNEAAQNQYDLLVVGIVIATIVIVKASLRDQLYKKSALDYVECTFYFNLLLLILVSYFSLTHYPDYQKAVAKASVTATFITFLGILFYHSYLILSNTKLYNRLKQKGQHALGTKNSKSNGYGFSFARNSVRSKPTLTEVGLSDAVTESTSEGEPSLTSETSKVRKIADTLFNVSRRNQRFQMSTKSYNSMYLRESLLLDH